IVERYDHPPDWAVSETVPFSSARKWSAAAFADHGAWFLGAPDILLTRAPDPEEADEARRRLDHYASRGRRVLMLGLAPDGLTGDELPDRVEPVALVVLDEQLRESAPDTIAYFGA